VVDLHRGVVSFLRRCVEVGKSIICGATATVTSFGVRKVAIWHGLLTGVLPRRLWLPGGGPSHGKEEFVRGEATLGERAVEVERRVG